LVLTLLLLLSWDPDNFNWDPANLFLSPHSHPPPPPGPAFFSQESVDARKVEMFSERVASRQARIREVCKRHNATLSWDEKRREGSMKRHIWDVVNHLVFCPIAKVASTTWFLNFLAWSKIERASVPLVLDQLKEAVRRKEKGEINWKGEAGGRGNLGDGAEDQVVDDVPDVPLHASLPPLLVPTEGCVVPFANLAYPCLP
jgi:hypothetical protein